MTPRPPLSLLGQRQPPDGSDVDPSADLTAYGAPGGKPDRRSGLDLAALLDVVEASHPSAGVEALAHELSERVGAIAVCLLVVDINGKALVRLDRTKTGSEQDDSDLDRIELDGTAAGRSIREQRTILEAVPGGVRVLTPVSERGETVGVLELLLPGTPTGAVLAHVASAAHALAYVVIADRRHTDAYELGQRGSRLSLEAEIQRRLLPESYSCQGPQFALAGWQVPADSAGGDTFDYVVGEHVLSLSITDAMGHGVPAAMLATLAVGSIRNSRRGGCGLAEQARRANEALTTHAEPDQFVTALMAEIDLATGAARLVNAGHVAPLLVRNGLVTEVRLAPGIVLGVAPDLDLEVQHLQLEPGDRVVLLTDGMFERAAADAEVAQVLAGLGAQHPREVGQTLTRAVLEVTDGAVRDDATVMVLDWYGPVPPAETLP